MFDRSAPSSLANAFLMAELANAAYPSGMAVVANTKLGTAAYQAAFSRKWVDGPLMPVEFCNLYLFCIWPAAVLLLLGYMEFRG
jgi:hypothetical protein